MNTFNKNRSLSDKEIKEVLWDDGVKYTVYLGLFVIFLIKKSILFGFCSIGMLIYFIGFECKYVLNISNKTVKKYLIIKACITIVLLFIIKSVKENNRILVPLLLSQYLMSMLVFWSLIWNKNIYFDDNIVNLSTLFTTKNGEYSRTAYVAHELNLSFHFLNKYTTVAENIRYLDKLANQIINLGDNKLEKLKLILSVDSKKNNIKSILWNCVYFIVILIITGKASIQLGTISGIDVKIKNSTTIISIIIALFLWLIMFFPLILKIYENAQIIKDRKLLLIIIKRAIQIRKQESN